ncbi:hypothetical protein [Pseudomonas sp. F01002]|uniref:hypothetical protein n=1 Tax=Pseudomonas sp. F01002 TaxID=2555724 RepID=UPI003531E142
MQRGHDHQTNAQATPHQPRAAHCAIKHRQQQTRAATHQKRLNKRVVPVSQTQREEEHQSDQAQHDSVGFAVVVKKTRGQKHSLLLHVIEPE